MTRGFLRHIFLSCPFPLANEGKTDITSAWPTNPRTGYFVITTPGLWDSRQGRSPSHQLGVVFLSSLEDREIRVGIFPQFEEVLESPLRFRRIARKRQAARHSKV
jgi:hypothetical protein